MGGDWKLNLYIAICKMVEINQIMSRVWNNLFWGQKLQLQQQQHQQSENFIN